VGYWHDPEGAAIMDAIFEGESPRARLALLLQHFSALKDEREPWRIAYPLKEILLLVTCGTIASCDDFDDIVAWGEHHLDFLRQFSEFHHGIPCERWLFRSWRKLTYNGKTRPLITVSVRCDRARLFCPG
jgi:DDE_Tnp_1-associated